MKITDRVAWRSRWRSPPPLPRSAQNAATVPQFQVDPFWPKPLPNNWLLGQVSGIATDKYDRIWVVHRPGSLTPRERAAEQNPPEAKCCVAAPPVLLFDQSGNLIRHWGGPGQGYRMARERARHLRRRQRFRLARRQRQEGRPAPQVHHGRQVRPADRQVRARATTATRPSGSARRPTSRSTSPRRKCSPPTATPTAAWSCSIRDRRLQAPLGRLRQASRATRRRRLRSGASRRRSSSATRCTASASTRTAWSTSATAPTIACRSSARTAPSSPSTSSRRRRAAPARSTTSCSRPTRSRRSST